MATPKRHQGPGRFHVFTVATGGGAFFQDDEDRHVFRALLLRTARRLSWDVHAYCLLTSHYHAVLETPSANLSKGLQRINSSYVVWFNDRWRRRGALVARRFGYRVIETDEYLTEACRYVLSNPVTAGLCETPDDWPWSGGSAANDLSSL